MLHFVSWSSLELHWSSHGLVRRIAVVRSKHHVPAGDTDDIINTQLSLSLHSSPQALLAVTRLYRSLLSSSFI